MLLVPDPVTRTGLWLAKNDDGDLTSKINKAESEAIRVQGVPVGPEVYCIPMQSRNRFASCLRVGLLTEGEFVEA